MLNRRLLMAQAGAEPPSDWDIDWKCIDGPLENFGWTKSIRGSASSTMLDDGLHLKAGGGAFVKYDCPISTCKKCVCEIELSASALDTTLQGFRPIVSNGISGVQLSINTYGIHYPVGDQEAYGGKTIGKITTNKDYLIRIDYSQNGKNRVALNRNILIETTDYSTAYAGGNKFFQQNGGETVLKALRYKFLEV